MKNLLESEISRLTTRIKSLQDDLVRSNAAAQETILYQPITQYAWDQSDKFVKIFIEPSVAFEESDVKFTVTSKRSFTLTFKDYRLQINKLGGDIDAEASTVKLGKGKITLSLKKEKEKVAWSGLKDTNNTAKKAAEEDKDDLGPGDDPSAGLMKLMKKMYDEGDDDMKRTISQTWYESQRKQMSSQLPDMNL